jgi:phosphonate transport system substrate-binding protein
MALHGHTFGARRLVLLPRALRRRRSWTGMTAQLRVTSHLAPSVLPLYEAIADVLAARLGREPRFEVAESYERCAADIDDVCFVCSLPYLLFSAAGRMKMEVLAAPVLAGERYGGRPIYFSDVVVARDSPFRALSDLRGRRWAYNEPFSHSGYLTVVHQLVRMGEDLSFFGPVVEAGFHSEALRLVADGRVDGAAIDSQVLAIELRDDPELAERVRVIGSIGPSTIQPVVASASRLSADERGALREVLLGLHADARVQPFMRAAMVDRFVPMDDPSYDDIRAMLARVSAAGALDEAWRARWAAVSGAAPLPATMEA